MTQKNHGKYIPFIISDLKKEFSEQIKKDYSEKAVNNIFFNSLELCLCNKKQENPEEDISYIETLAKKFKLKVPGTFKHDILFKP